MMTYYKRVLLIILVLFSFIGCDQVSKVAARKYLVHSLPVSYFCDILRLQYTENKGAFLSLGSAFPEEFHFWLLIVFTGVVVSGMLVFIIFKRTLNLYFATSISFIIGEGVGNLIDRMTNNGAVIDFMNIGIGRLRTGIFNFADVAIMIGMGMFIFLGFKRTRSRNSF
jgi:signal peptidase II